MSRHGAGMDDGDYINMQMVGSHAKLIELQTRNQLKNAPTGDTGLVKDGLMDKIKNELEEDQE